MVLSQWVDYYATCCHMLALTASVVNNSANSIMALSPRAFLGLSQLVTLDLSVNVITYLPTGVFNDLKSLNSLLVLIVLITIIRLIQPRYLQHNALTYLQVGVFTGLSHLKYCMRLYNNLISHIEPTVFNDVPNLDWLYAMFTESAVALMITRLMYSNSLTYISKDTFSGLTALTDLFVVI